MHAYTRARVYDLLQYWDVCSGIEEDWRDVLWSDSMIYFSSGSQDTAYVLHENMIIIFWESTSV